MFLCKAIVYKFIDSVLSDEQHDLAPSTLRKPMDSVLGLQKIHQIETAIYVNSRPSLRQRKTFSGGSWISYKHSHLWILLKTTDCDVTGMSCHFPVESNGTHRCVPLL